MGPRGAPGPQPARVGALEELQRRRVFRVALAYVAITYAVLSAADLVFVRMAAPELAERVLLGIAVLGFPVAIVLSFVYDVTPTGIVRTPEDATDDPSYAAGPWKAWAATVTAAILIGVLIRYFGR